MSSLEQRQEAASEADSSEQRRFVGTVGALMRLVEGILGKLRDEKLHLQSTSLAYTTLLSLVPFLAVTFSVLKGFGVQNQLEPMLMRTLEPLGEQGVQIGQYILTYVSNLNFAVLGFFGVAMLFWTVISLLTRVEEAFNAIWHVPGMRRWTRRFSDYLSVALVGPVFIFAALGVTAVVFRSENVHRYVAIEPLGELLLGFGRLIPYLLVCLAFAFLYAFLTNIRVRLVPALAGGVFASLAWYGVGTLFAHLVAGSSKYSAIYSSMAAVVLFIIWVNIGWLIVLVGAHIARYVQHPHLLKHHIEGLQFGQVFDESLVLNIMVLIARSYHFGGPKWTLESLTARGCCGSPDQVEALLQALRDGNLIVATNDDPEAYLPARPIETITLGEIVAMARSRRGGAGQHGPVQEIVAGIEAAVAGSLAGKTLKDLVPAESSGPVPIGQDPEEALLEDTGLP